jgi:hypothetical protein
VREAGASAATTDQGVARATVREEGASTPRDCVQLRLAVGPAVNKVGSILGQLLVE